MGTFISALIEIPKRLLLFSIRFYQRFISVAFPPRCKYLPSCSSYALESVSRFGVVRGFSMAVWRILRCNPFSNGGVDDVPDSWRFSFKRNNSAVGIND